MSVWPTTMTARSGRRRHQLRDLDERRLGFGLDVGLVEIEEDAVERDAAGCRYRIFHFAGVDHHHLLVAGFRLQHMDDGDRAAVQLLAVEVVDELVGLHRDVCVAAGTGSSPRGSAGR